MPQSFVRMRVNMMRNLVAQQHFDTGRLTNITSPYASIPSTPPTSSGSGSRTNAFSPAVVAVIGVLAGAFLIVTYYRIFAKYCTRFRLPCWGTRINHRDDGPSAIVLMEEHIWPPNSMGLDESLINRIPTCKYDQQEGLVEGTECSVCLSEFEEGEVLRILPKCNHPFHIQCIDTWLQSHSTCPLCRVNIVLAAGLPFALMPLEMEIPVRGSFHALVPATTPMHSLVNHEIEMLQEQYMEELLDGQMSGPTNSISITSSRADSFGVAPDVQTADNHQVYVQETTQELIEHVRHLSLEQALIHTGEIPTVTSSSNPVIHGAPRLRTQLSAPTKKRPYNRTRSDRKRNQAEGVDRSRGLCNKSSDRKGKHPLIQLSSPQMKRFAGLVRSHSAGSSSSNQVVVELLAQEIFKESFVSHAKSAGASSSSILETSVRKLSKVSGSKEGSTSGGSSSTRQVAGNSNTRNARRMSSIGEEDDNSLLEFENETSEFVLEQHELAMLEMAHRENLMTPQRPKSTVMPEERKRRFSRGSCDFTRSSKSLKVPTVTGNPKLCDTWPQQSRSFKNSILKMKRCGSVGPRPAELPFQKNEKVHASEPMFEIFDFS